MYTNPKRGFTLIELLVVISIIALLTLGILAALDAARAKGRDAERISDLKQIQVALELYYAQNKEYPDNLDLLAPDHINSLPNDPKTDDPYDYRISTAGSRNVDFAIETTSEADDTKKCQVKSLNSTEFSSPVCPFQ